MDPFPGLLNPLQRSSLTKSSNLQATGKQPVHVEGDLIVRARVQFGMHGLSRLFSFHLYSLEDLCYVAERSKIYLNVLFHAVQTVLNAS